MLWWVCRSMGLEHSLRTSIAQAGLLDPVEHLGSLFWLMHRSSEIDHANIVIDQVLWEHKVTLSMPFKKGEAHRAVAAAGPPDHPAAHEPEKH